MKALSRSRALFQTVGEGDAWKRQVEEVRATVSHEALFGFRGGGHGAEEPIVLAPC